MIARGLLRLAVPLVVVLTIASNLSVLAGRGQPVHPALAGFNESCEGQRKPCWRGIVPGVTTIAEMRERMAYAGDGTTLFDDLTESYFLYYLPPDATDLCIIGFQTRGSYILRGQIQVCEEQSVRIGDLTGVFGLPRKTVLTPPSSVAYDDVVANTIGWRARLTPFSKVSFINLVIDGESDLVMFGWHGFMPNWRFCQLEPMYPLCGGR